MNDAIKWALKIGMYAILWVFVLSIRVDGRPMFNYANEVLVQNSVVRAIDSELGELWYKASTSAKAAFTHASAEQEKSM